MSEQGRALVEAWGVRWDGAIDTDAVWRSRTDAGYEAGTHGTVVPLIAADRLTDEALVEAVARKMQPSLPTRYRPETEGVLAALRAVLEEQA